MATGIPDELAKALIEVPRTLRKERGWSGAKLVGAVKLIQERLAAVIEHGPDYSPRDPDLDWLDALNAGCEAVGKGRPFNDLSSVARNNIAFLRAAAKHLPEKSA